MPYHDDEKRKAYNKDWKRKNAKQYNEYRRVWQWNKRHADDVPRADLEDLVEVRKRINYPHGGNEKYRELDSQEREWLKDAVWCVICRTMHPPMRSERLS
jgi:hypothetical protein